MPNVARRAQGGRHSCVMYTLCPTWGCTGPFFTLQEGGGSGEEEMLHIHVYNMYMCASIVASCYILVSSYYIIIDWFAISPYQSIVLHVSMHLLNTSTLMTQMKYYVIYDICIDVEQCIMRIHYHRLQSAQGHWILNLRRVFSKLYLNFTACFWLAR